jgi:hypothetical protein
MHYIIFLKTAIKRGMEWIHISFLVLCLLPLHSGYVLSSDKRNDQGYKKDFEILMC